MAYSKFVCAENVGFGGGVVFGTARARCLVGYNGLSNTFIHVRIYRARIFRTPLDGDDDAAACDVVCVHAMGDDDMR